MPTSKQPRLGAHELKYLAQELGQAVRALVDQHSSLREELFLAAKAVRREKRAKRDMPKCNAFKASGGRCATRLEPGQFRCALHEQELRDRRRSKVGKRKPGGDGEGGAGGPAAASPEPIGRGGETANVCDTGRGIRTPRRDASEDLVCTADEGSCVERKSGS